MYVHECIFILYTMFKVYNTKGKKKDLDVGIFCIMLKVHHMHQGREPRQLITVEY